MCVCVGFSRFRSPFFKYLMSVDNRAKTIDSSAASCGFYQSHSAYVVFNCLKCLKSQLQCLYIFPYKSTPIFFKVCNCGMTGISTQIVGEMFMMESFGAMLQATVKDIWIQKLCIYCGNVDSHSSSCIFYQHVPGKKSRSTCVVCFEAATILFPCKHVVCCPNCALNVDHCPLCRQPADYFKILTF